MSLQTDAIFIKALQSNEVLTAKVEGRIYDTAIPLPDEDADNAPTPYIIVTYDGMSNDQSTKDDAYEADSDNVSISVLVIDKTLEDLHELTSMIRDTIHDYFVEHVDEDDEVPVDYNFTAQGITYDSMKPCFWQKLSYQCDTNR